MKPTIVDWNHYTLKAAGGRALAYLTHAKAGVGPFAEAKGKTDEAALEALQAELTNREAERPRDHGRKIQTPTQSEFEWAIEALDFSDPVDGMLRALALAGREGISAGELAEVAGYSDYSAANLQLGLAAAEIGKLLGLRVKNETQETDSVAATFLIADEGPKKAETGNWTWIPRPELVAAMDIKQKKPAA